MYKIDRGGGGGVQKSFNRTDPTIYNKKYLLCIISGLGKENFCAERCGQDRPTISTIFNKISRCLKLRLC